MVSARPDWDTYFLDIAAAVSKRADCTRRQVGAVIVDRNHRIVSTGYNGAPAGEPGCASARACPRGRLTREEMPSYADGNQDFSNCIAIHAEDNALRYAKTHPAHDHGTPETWLGELTLYTTSEPCRPCSELIVDAGIVRVVTSG